MVAADDLNVIEPGHIPHHPVFGQWEYDFYRSFPATGLAEAYRASHPHTSEDSWFGRSGEGYRFDRVFVTAPHTSLIRSCTYLHGPRQQGLTDHAAMTLFMQPAAENG